MDKQLNTYSSSMFLDELFLWISKLLGGKSRLLYVQFFRYLLVGGIATVVDFGILGILTSGLDIHYLISNVFSFLAGLVTNYFLSIRWVFPARTIKSRTAEFVVFGVVGLAGLAISELCMYVGVEAIRLHYTWAKCIAVACALLWNFGVRKLLLFREKRS